MLDVHVQWFDEVAVDQSNAVFDFVNQLQDAALQALRGVIQRIELKLVFFFGLRSLVKVALFQVVLAFRFSVQVGLELLVAPIEFFLEVGQGRCEVDTQDGEVVQQFGAVHVVSVNLWRLVLHVLLK